MHDGSQLLLRKVAEDYNPSDKMTAMRLLHETARRGEFATGILYIEPDKDDFIDTLNLVESRWRSCRRSRSGRRRRCWTS